MKTLGAVDPLYVQARCVLLDVLDALGLHKQSVVLVGAQAIYMHTGEGDLAVAPYTTDGDVVIDPRVLSSEPKLEEVMKKAGCVRADNPGVWTGKHGIQIDLLVPEALASPGRRGAENNLFFGEKRCARIHHRSSRSGRTFGSKASQNF